MSRIIVTGGAGFVGSALGRHIINDMLAAVCMGDKLTCAGNLDNLAPVAKSDRFKFEKVDICDKDELDHVFADFKPTHVMHLAAESHVDRSIDGSSEFIQTNIVGFDRVVLVLGDNIVAYSNKTMQTIRRSTIIQRPFYNQLWQENR